MLKTIRHWLFGSSRSQPLIKAQAQRAAARAAVIDAETRRDDRDLGRARMILQEATTRELQAGRVAG